MKTEKLKGTAYSYIRFSAKEQERGDSLRRQTELRDEWLKRNPGVILDESLTLRDLGVSGFRGKHLSDANALGQFLKLVESGRIAKDSLLLLENLDRLSRQDELTATHLFTGILLAGIRIVQLEPLAVFDRDAGQLDIMRAVLELGRAHAESARKSVRVTQAWDQRKKAAATTGKPLTGRCPAWLRVVNDKYEFKPGARDLIRRMFQMCIDGHGCRAIAAAFMRESIPSWSPAWVAGHWEEPYIRKIIGGREVLGEFQPMTRNPDPESEKKRIPDGPVLANYFPIVVTEKEWDAAQAARKLRDKRGGRPTTDPDHVNVFSGLLHDARTGTTLQIGGRTDRGRYYRILLPAGYKRHGDACVSFPLTGFEEPVLDLLNAIDPRELLPEQDVKGNAVLELSGQLQKIEGRLASMQTDLQEGDGDVKGIMAAMRTLETNRQKVADKLTAARRAAASPAMESWGDTQGLVEVLRSAADPRDARIRLRAALRRIVSGIWCLFMQRQGDVQLAAVQLWFDPGHQHRDYLIIYQTARAGKGQKTRLPRSVPFTLKEIGLADSLDLREPEHVARVEKFLNTIDTKKFAALIARGK